MKTHGRHEDVFGGGFTQPVQYGEASQGQTFPPSYDTTHARDINRRGEETGPVLHGNTSGTRNDPLGNTIQTATGPVLAPETVTVGIPTTGTSSKTDVDKPSVYVSSLPLYQLCVALYLAVVIITICVVFNSPHVGC